MAKKFKTTNYDRAVYNILNEQFVNGWGPMTRREIEGKVGKQFKDHQWSLVMKKVRFMVEQNGLIVPFATAEGGFSYEITNDPNPVMPGMLQTMQAQSAHRANIAKMRRFIEPREGSLDKRLNGNALEAADAILAGEAALEKMMQVASATFRDILDDRKDRVAEAAVSANSRQETI